MQRERVANNIYVFTSELYAQVTAGAIITGAGAVVIDTLPFPSETRQIIKFIRERHNVPVRYVINTHYHADHCYGTCLFEGAYVVSHHLCRTLLDGPAREGLERARRTARELAMLTIRLPDIVFDEGMMSLHIGGMNVQMWHTPGHSPDSIVCLVGEERILFAADTLMPIPFFADGSWSDFVNSLMSLRDGQFENVIQGHGEVILRGEVQSKIDEDIAYLHAIRKRVEKLVDSRKDKQALSRIDIEACGKSRIPLNGLMEQLHHRNLEALYDTLQRERAVTAS